MTDSVDILAFGAHPDDVELTVGGTLLAAGAQGQSFAIVDLSAGESGTRGTRELRAQEAARAAQILGAAGRECLGLPDGAILLNEASRLAVIASIRRWKPRIVLAPHEDDLHPDHSWAGRIVREAAFLAGVAKVGSDAAHRPQAVLSAFAHTVHQPGLVVDISQHFQRKREACQAYQSQFHNPASTEPGTFISRPEFWHWWEGRARAFGQMIGAEYGEAFAHRGPLRVDNLVEQFRNYGYYPRGPR